MGREAEGKKLKRNRREKKLESNVGLSSMEDYISRSEDLCRGTKRERFPLHLKNHESGEKNRNLKKRERGKAQSPAAWENIFSKYKRSYKPGGPEKEGFQTDKKKKKKKSRVRGGNKWSFRGGLFLLLVLCVRGLLTPSHRHIRRQYPRGQEDANLNKKKNT